MNFNDPTGLLRSGFLVRPNPQKEMKRRTEFTREVTETIQTLVTHPGAAASGFGGAFMEGKVADSLAGFSTLGFGSSIYGHEDYFRQGGWVGKGSVTVMAIVSGGYAASSLYTASAAGYLGSGATQTALTFLGEGAIFTAEEMAVRSIWTGEAQPAKSALWGFGTAGVVRGLSLAYRGYQAWRSARYLDEASDMVRGASRSGPGTPHVTEFDEAVISTGRAVDEFSTIPKQRAFVKSNRGSPSVPNGWTDPEFGRFLKWTNEKSFTKNMDIVDDLIGKLPNRLDEFRRFGVTEKIARDWAKFYRGAHIKAIRGGGFNPNALPRARYMEAIQELLK